MFCKQNVVDTIELQHEIIRLHFCSTRVTIKTLTTTRNISGWIIFTEIVILKHNSA
jgi:hypothetical protein